MSYRKCSPEEFNATLMGELQNYSQDVTTKVKKAIDTVGKEVNKEIKSHVTFKGSGDYVKSFRVTKTYEDGYKKTKKWHVINGNYRLTHLLENGHALPQGGRAKAYPHIKYGDKIAEKRMQELSEEAVKDAGR